EPDREAREGAANREEGRRAGARAPPPLPRATRVRRADASPGAGRRGVEDPARIPAAFAETAARGVQPGRAHARRALGPGPGGDGSGFARTSRARDPEPEGGRAPGVSGRDGHRAGRALARDPGLLPA